MSSLANRHIVLGITGSIAAYKCCELVRNLKKLGAQVRVVLTAGGKEFVTPLTLQALSGERVYADLLDDEAEAAMGHIELARWADIVLVAPASANFIARLVQGRADDLLTTLCVATEAPIYIAPAMNQQMWQQAATQQNVIELQKRNVIFWGPAEGEQACGECGPGRLLEPDELLERLAGCFASGVMAGKRVLITAGPTQELIDPVRYLSNHSSGKMGYALAVAARDAGAQVTLISGPVALDAPEGMELVSIVTSADMHATVLARVVEFDVFISAAAVVDYQVESIAERKLKKTSEELVLKLIKTPDILAEVGALPKKPFLVGFAAETHDLMVHAEEKLNRKALDMIVANEVGKDKGFGVDDNAAIVLSAKGVKLELPLQSKRQLAVKLIEHIAESL